MKNTKMHVLQLKTAVLALLCVMDWGYSCAQHASNPLPNHRQLAWQRAESGVVFHYDLHVFDGVNYRQSHNRITPVPDYNIFNPEELDVEQWVLVAKAMGARFAILTATHETGFALFQSDYNPYSLKAVKWRDGKADIVKDFVEACRKHDIEPGIYLGIRWNSFFGVHDFKVDGTGKMQENRQAYYNSMVEGMLTEICTKYGPLFKIWFDGGASSPEKGAPDVLPIVRKYQPNCLFYHNDQLAEARWAGSETGTVGYPNWSTFPFKFTSSGEGAPEEIAQNNFYLLKHGDPSGEYWVPTMADAPLRGYGGRHEWFWEPDDEKHIYPLEELIRIYNQSVGRNATLILGLTPDDRGLMPDEDVQRLTEFGEAIQKRFDNPLASTAGKGNRVELTLPKAMPINQLVLQENIEIGHRVKRFRIEAKVNGRWKTIHQAESIGHKYIGLLEEPVRAKKFRFVADEVFAEPDLIVFSLYHIDEN